MCGRSAARTRRARSNPWTCQSPRISFRICPRIRGRCRLRFDRTGAKPLTNMGVFVVLVNEGLTPKHFAKSCGARVTVRSLGGDRSRLLVHRDVPRLGRYAVEPAANRRKGREVEIAFVRDVRVGIERDVGD